MTRLPLGTGTGTGIEHAVSDVTDVLLAPVLVLALIALALTLVETGRVIAEVLARRGRGIARIDLAVTAVGAALADGDSGRAVELTRGCTAGGRMADTAEALLGARGSAGESRRAKLLADFDYGSLRGLERTRVLVRAGPALGLMGTLIPLSPALQALSRGDVSTLATDLRVAFSVTVLGLLIGAIAFAVSLVRDRIYGQDLSDLEYLSDGFAATPAASPANSPAASPT